MIDPVEIKPCPYCGGLPEEAHKEKCYMRFVLGEIDPTHDEIAVAWNARPIEVALRADLEAAKAENTRLIEQVNKLSHLAGQKDAAEIAQMYLADWRALNADIEALKADRDSEQRWANQYHQEAERLRAELHRAMKALREIQIDACENIRMGGCDLYTVEAIARAALPEPPKEE